MSEAVERIGAYEVVGLIARGGMATVYQARQPALGRTVALKRLDLRTSDPSLVERFIRESRIAASFDHPNIVTVFDFFEWEGVPYIAMEHLPRGSLRPWIGHLDPYQTFGILEGVLAALSHAEQHAVAHRDLKPENVLVTGRGAVKIADFGIAKAYTATTGGFTQTGMAVGTPAYMAPEQALGTPVGPYTDLYALGVMTYEMLSGAPPFGGTDTPMAIMYRHVNEVPPRLQEMDERVAAWVANLLEKAPEARPASAADAWQALEEVVVDLVGPYWRRHCALEEPRTQRGAVAAETVARRRAPPESALTVVPGRARAGPFADGTPAPAPVETPPASGHAAPPPLPGGAPPAVGPPYTPPPGGGSEVVAPGTARTLISRPAAAPARESPRGQRRRRVVAAVAGFAVLAAGGVAALVLNPSPPPPQPRPPARAFDFDGDGRRTIVAGMPRWRPDGGGPFGAVELPDSGRLITAAVLGRAAGSGAEAQFGMAVASGDFDRDGHADLAVSAPGANVGSAGRVEGAVAVVAGSGRGLLRNGMDMLVGPGPLLPYDEARYGYAMAAGDLDGDRYADLVVGAPGSAVDGGKGAVQIIFGGRDGLRSRRTRILRRPRAGDVGFGTAVRLGDVNGDGSLDVIAGAAGDPGSAPAHVAYCPGGKDGPRSCRLLVGTPEGGPPSLGVGDVTGDGFSDVVAGRPGAVGTAGAIALWRGTRRGPVGSPQTITQESPGVWGNSQAGDELGRALVVARVDRDRFADIVVAAPGEDAARGRIIVLHGAREGYDAATSDVYGAGFTPPPGGNPAGSRFGSSITVVDTPDDTDTRRDLVTALPGVGRIAVLPGRGRAFTSDGGTSTPLGEAGDRGHLPPGTLIRLGRSTGA